jgi:hypothetical protein
MYDLVRSDMFSFFPFFLFFFFFFFFSSSSLLFSSLLFTSLYYFLVLLKRLRIMIVRGVRVKTPTSCIVVSYFSSIASSSGRLMVHMWCIFSCIFWFKRLFISERIGQWRRRKLCLNTIYPMVRDTYDYRYCLNLTILWSTRRNRDMAIPSVLYE